MPNLVENYRILIIDDMTSIHQDFKKILLPEQNNTDQLDKMHAMIMGSTQKKKSLPPFEIDFATQGVEGILLAKKAIEEKRPYAVAFVDVQMPPGQDGVETIDRLWRIDPDIQTVICTAYAKYTWEDLQTRFGDTDRLFLLKKPFDNLEVIQLACSLSKRWNINRTVQYQLSLVKNMPSTNKVEMESSISQLKKSVETLSKLTNKFADTKK